MPEWRGKLAAKRWTFIVHLRCDASINHTLCGIDYDNLGATQEAQARGIIHVWPFKGEEASCPSCLALREDS